MKTTLFLDESVDHLMTVLAEVLEHERDVHPAGAGLWILLPYQLVEGQVVLDIVEPTSSFFYVAVDAEVSGLSLQVLGVIDTANNFVQCLTAKAGANLDGLVHGDPQRFQHVDTEINEVYHLLHAGFVVDTFRLRSLRGIHFFNCKVHGDWCIHKS